MSVTNCRSSVHTVQVVVLVFNQYCATNIHISFIVDFTTHQVVCINNINFQRKSVIVSTRCHVCFTAPMHELVLHQAAAS